jgi:hypothetical protein
MNALFDVVIQRAFASRHSVHLVLNESVQSVASGYGSDGRWHRGSAFASDQIHFGFREQLNCDLLVALRSYVFRMSRDFS